MTNAPPGTPPGAALPASLAATPTAVRSPMPDHPSTTIHPLGAFVSSQPLPLEGGQCSGMPPHYDKPSLKVSELSRVYHGQRKAETSHAKLLSLTRGFWSIYPLCRDQQRGQ